MPIEIFSPETYAYQLDNGWELNASAQIKGLKPKINNEEFIYSVTYSADIISPSNDTLKSIDSGEVEKTAEENLSDIQLEIQAELDSTFAVGQYQIIINIKDKFSDKTAKLQSTFELTAD